MASPRIQQSMWAFVILAQVASYWSHFNQSEPGLVFSDDAGGFTAGDDKGIAAASKKASDESKHFHCSIELYHFAPVAVLPAK